MLSDSKEKFKKKLRKEQVKLHQYEAAERGVRPYHPSKPTLFRKVDVMYQNEVLAAQKKRAKKQFQLHFTRSVTGGKYKTTVRLVRGERNDPLPNHGILHRIVNQKYRLTGDVPSVSKYLKSKMQKWKPLTTRGRTAKTLLQVTGFSFSAAAKTALRVGLAKESGEHKINEFGAQEVGQDAKRAVYKYQRESQDDAGKGTSESLKLTYDAIRGIYRHFVQKEQHQKYTAQYRLTRYDVRDLRAKNKPDLKKSKYQLKRKKLILKPKNCNLSWIKQREKRLIRNNTKLSFVC